MIITLLRITPWQPGRSFRNLRHAVGEIIIGMLLISVITRQAIQRTNVVSAGALRVPQAHLQSTCLIDKPVVLIDFILVIRPLRVLTRRVEESLRPCLKILRVLLDLLNRVRKSPHVRADALKIIGQVIRVGLHVVHRRVERLLLRRGVIRAHARPRRLDRRTGGAHITRLRA